MALVLGQPAEASQYKIKNFYLGMDRAEVQEQYALFQKNKIAEYISIEKEQYRDLIKLDNAFSSMGNLLEIGYDENEKCNDITFQYKTVNILFDAAKLDVEAFIQKLQKDYNIPEMEYHDMGVVKIWKYEDTEQGIKISVDNNKNLRLQYLKQ